MMTTMTPVLPRGAKSLIKQMKAKNKAYLSNMAELDMIARRDDGMGLVHNVARRTRLREMNSAIVATQIQISVAWDKLTWETSPATIWDNF